MRARMAVAVGVVVFLVLAGVGTAAAYWTASASTTGTVKAATVSTNCTAPDGLVNGGFESPDVSPNSFQQIASIPGWKVTGDSVFEVWHGYAPPALGAQNIELNANAPATVYQSITTVPGQTLHWSLQHRGRFGNDTMRVSINADGAALVQQAQFTTGTAAWQRYSGVYVVPAGQTSTRLSLTSVSTTSEPGQNNAASVGNLVDDVSFGTGPCLSPIGAVSNITVPGSSYHVGDTVQYTTTVTDVGGGSAQGSTFSAVLPTGLAYVAGSLVVDGTAVSDAASDDVGEYTAGAVTARLGQGATASAGGVISPDQLVTVTFRATIGAAAAGTTPSYAATVSYADALAPGWAMTATAPPVVITVSAAADIAVTVLAKPSLVAGRTVSWTFTVTNNGPATSTGVSATVTVPTNVTAATAGSTQGSCTTAGATKSCTIGTLASGASAVLTLTGTLPGTLAGSYPSTATVTSTGVDPNTGNNSVTNSGVVDTTAPSAPTGLTTGATTGTQTTLNWTASTDNVAVTGYQIYRNGVQVGTTTGATSYTATGLTAGTPSWFWVKAVDFAGNVSAASTGVGVVQALAAGTYYRVGYPLGAECLTAVNANNNAPLQIAACATGDGEQRWQFTAVGTGGAYRITPQTTPGRAWDLSGANPPSSADGVAILLSTANVTATRTTWVPAVHWDGTTAQLFITNGATGVCVDVQNRSTTAGTPVQQFTCNDTPAQWFTLTVAP